MKFNSFASLAIFSIIPVLFWKQNSICHTSVNCVWFLLSYISLQSNWVRKPSKLGLFSFRLCLRCNNVNYGAWHVYKPLFGSSVATCRLVCSEISLSINENKQERSPRNGQTQYNLADGVTASAQLCTLEEHALSTNDSPLFTPLTTWVTCFRCILRFFLSILIHTTWEIMFQTCKKYQFPKEARRFLWIQQ